MNTSTTEIILNDISESSVKINFIELIENNTSKKYFFRNNSFVLIDTSCEINSAKFGSLHRILTLGLYDFFWINTTTKSSTAKTFSKFRNYKFETVKKN